MASRQTAHTEFTGGAADLLATYQQMREADRQLGEERRANARAAREQHREEQENLRRAEQMTREVQTPLEQYRERVNEIERAYEEGNIDQDTYNRQLALQRDRLREAEGGHNTLISKVSTLASGYLSVSRAMRFVIDANQEVIRQSEEIGEKFDTLFRKFQIQAGLRGLQGRAAQRSIEEIAVQQAVPIEQAAEAATQLVSSGFSADQASGSALRELLGIMSASNLRGQDVDSAALAKSVSQFLESQGLDKTGENLFEVTAGVNTLFKHTNLQLAQLSDLAKVAAPLKGRATVPEQFAAFSSLLGVLEAPEAATGLRNVTNRLAAASGTPSRVKALEQIGLSPEDVDFVGEGFTDVLRRVQGGVEQLPEEQRATVLTKLFGERTIAAAKQLLTTADEIDRRAQRFTETDDVRADIQFATAGEEAGRIRRENRRQIRRAQQDEGGDDLLGELQEQSEQIGEAPFVTAGASGLFKFFRGFGVDPETAARLAFRRHGAGEDDPANQAVNRALANVQTVEQGADAQGIIIEEMRNNNALLERQLELQERQAQQPQQVEVINQPEPEPATIESPAASLGAP